MVNNINPEIDDTKVSVNTLFVLSLVICGIAAIIFVAYLLYRPHQPRNEIVVKDIVVSGDVADNSENILESVDSVVEKSYLANNNENNFLASSTEMTNLTPAIKNRPVVPSRQTPERIATQTTERIATQTEANTIPPNTPSTSVVAPLVSQNIKPQLSPVKKFFNKIARVFSKKAPTIPSLKPTEKSVAVNSPTTNFSRSLATTSVDNQPNVSTTTNLSLPNVSTRTNLSLPNASTLPQQGVIKGSPKIPASRIRNSSTKEDVSIVNNTLSKDTFKISKVTSKNSNNSVKPFSRTTKTSSVKTQIATRLVTKAPAIKRAKPKKKLVTVKGYWIQVGSFATSTTANNSVKKLKARGLASRVILKTVNGKSVYRVRIGAYMSRLEADKLCAEVQKIEEYKGSYVSETTTQKYVEI